VSLRRGRIAGPNPWDADSLEWATPSPPPPYNFVIIPAVASRSPLWEDRLAASEHRSSIGEGMVLDHGKEIVATSAVDGQPEVILKMPEDSILPLLAALALTGIFVGALAPWWWLVAVCSTACLVLACIWLWPRDRLAQTAEPHP
jgi:hypothetical protein